MRGLLSLSVLLKGEQLNAKTNYWKFIDRESNSEERFRAALYNEGKE